jgi:3-oxoacyl-[acyl-carrier-protein] synthase-3
MGGIRIAGFGRSQGDKTVTNDELALTVDTSDSWIREKTGIRSRFFAEDKTNADMAAAAAAGAIAQSGVDPALIELVLVCTFTPDKATPAMACEVAGRLGLAERIMALDINGACSGFIYGCTLADSLLKDRPGRYGLIIGSEKISPLLDMTDRNTCVLFGDGAGAVVVSYEEEGLFKSISGCVPDDDVLRCRRFDPAIEMKGREVYRFAVSSIAGCTRDILTATGLRAADIDHYVCHQANERIIDSAAARTGVPAARFFKNLYSYGNTSAASIPIALCEMEETGLLKAGEKVICTGFGAGLTYGTMLLEI